MTPKEKTIELVNSFYNNAESRNKIGAFDEDLHQYNCKQCALIAVDEIIEITQHESPSSWVYYMEVKKEIENL